MSIIIYCNLCFEIQQEIKRKFSITSCSHVLCEPCLGNSTNFCPLCKVQCKTLEISQQMPAEVKLYFERDSIKKLVQQIEKIRSFHTNQVRMYHNKTKPFCEKYKQVKEKALKLTNMRKNYVEMIQRDKKIMNRFKEAYHTNLITSDLFQLSSGPSPSANFASTLRSDISSLSRLSSTNSKLPLQTSAVSSLKTSTPSQAPSHRSALNSPRIYSPLNPSQTRRSASNLPQTHRSTSNSSQRSSLINSPAGSTTTPPLIANLYPKAYAQMKNLNIVANSSSPNLTRRSIFQDTRKGLLENTLRQMQQVSHSKYQAMRKQQRKI